MRLEFGEKWLILLVFLAGWREGFHIWIEFNLV
jgi:hypothetical protein